MRYAIYMLLLPILFLIGCTAETTGTDSTPAPAPDATQLQAHGWLLLELNGQPPVPGTTISLNFDAEAIGGNSGCNSYGGSYELVDGRLVISDIFSTLMACLDDGVMEQEAAFQQALRDATGFAVSDDGQTLELLNADGVVVARLTAANDATEPETADPADLQNSWLLIELNGRAPLDNREVTLNIADDSLGGNGGCNSYGGSYELRDGLLLISEIFSTMMACLEDSVMEQEAAYFEALNSVTAFELADNGQTLLLQNVNGETVLRFAAIAPEANAELEGSFWSLTTLISNEAASSLLAGSVITLSFDEEMEQVSGSAGCNNYFAAYTLAGDKLAIGPAGSTRMFCGDPDGVMEQETQFLTWLEEVENYEINGRQLTLTLSDGRALIFTAQ